MDGGDGFSFVNHTSALYHDDQTGSGMNFMALMQLVVCVAYMAWAL
jgi:hypothetical protein